MGHGAWGIGHGALAVCQGLNFGTKNLSDARKPDSATSCLVARDAIGASKAES
ncbi:MAG: hypothetical protein F6J93_06660 [Oscillatoria sp. SIO1A7]|nr:hypothetical protein [Oscillatoria sp. SIO1A7]